MVIGDRSCVTSKVITSFHATKCCQVLSSYPAVKLFSKYSNLCENIPERHCRQTDRRTTYCGIPRSA